MRQLSKSIGTNHKVTQTMRRKIKSQPKERFQNVTELTRLLMTSWKVQTKVFFEQSTLHGVRYIAENGRPVIEKFMWFACVSIGAVATAVIIVSLWEKFQTNPTITGLDTDFHNWNVPFPAITMCQEIPYNLTRAEYYFDNNFSDDSLGISIKLLTGLATLTFDTIKELQYTTFKNKTTNTFALKEVAFQIMNRCDEIFEDCQFKSYNFDCCDFFYPVFTEIGFCYTFNSRHYERTVPWSDKMFPDFKNRYIKETDIKWSLIFRVKDTSTNIPIYILNSDEQAGLDVQPQHIWDYKINKISFSLKQTYTTDDTRQLSIRQRHCVFPDELKLQTDTIYTYTACTRECRMDNSMKICKCVPHFYPQIGRYRHCDIHHLHCIWENLEAIKNVDHCFCHLSCHNTVYEVEKLNEMGLDKSNQLETRFVSWPMVRYKREVLFGWVDLLVSFGGIAGLFLGFSLLSGVEILYYFTIRAFCIVIRERNELARIYHEKVSKSPQDFDLSLVPYFCTEPFSPGNGLNEVARSYYKENLYRNKVAPLSKWKKSDRRILPPFGIEFHN